MAGSNTLSDNRNLALPFPASLAVSRYDLLYWDAAAKRVRPFTYKATLATEALDQAAVVANFLGFSLDTRLSAEADDGAIRTVGIEGPCDYDCPSQVFSLGDLVGPTWNGGTALVNQAVTKVSNVAQAIGVVIVQNAAAVTRVRFRLLSRVCWDVLTSRPDVGGQQGAGATVLSDASQTLTGGASPLLSMAPTTARTVTLPAEAQAAGFTLYFTNNSAGANSVTFVASGGGAIKGNGVVPQNKTCYLWCDGTNWNGLVSA